jgi:cation transport ATPase
MYYLTKSYKMDEGDSKNNQQAEKQRKQNNVIQRYSINAGTILQSLWIRCRTIFPNATDGKFMESELRFVLYSGVIFWGLYMAYEIFK